MRVAIAGAGIAGLCAAIALARKGFDVLLLENAEKIGEIGAGIQLSPNAVKVLRELGLAGPIGERSCEPAGIAIFDGRSGRRMTEIPLGETARRRYGAPYWLIHRADLQACLLAAVRAQPNIGLELGRNVENVRTEGEAAIFETGGATARADVLIAADGIRSEIRTGFFGHRGPDPERRVAWRAMLRGPTPPGVEAERTCLWLGPGWHLVHYPLRRGAELNLVLVTTDIDGTGSAQLHDLGAPLRALIESVDEWRPWPLESIDPRPAWTRGRVAMIGDAAHAMPPTAAQGGAQAIEDAWVLAACLAAEASEPAQALRRFEAARRPRVRRIAGEAARNLWLYGLSGAAATARNIAISVLPPKLHLARLDWLFGWPAK